MLSVKVDHDEIQIGNHFRVSFQRTLRIPDDGRDYPLPPGLGTFPIHRVEDYPGRVPQSWGEHGVFIPMYQREALWLSFDGHYWHPNAAKIGIGKINAITGSDWNDSLRSEPQDYLVVPDQPWLDGIKAGPGIVKQFVAMPLGMGYTVEGQITGKEEFGGIQIQVYDSKPGVFPEQPPFRESRFHDSLMVCCQSSVGEMGIGAGGRMKQKIYTDEYGEATWDQNQTGHVFVHIVNSLVYREITGLPMPPTPVSAQSYTEYGLPWFDLYNDTKRDVGPSEKLAQVKSIKEKDKEHGFSSQQDDSSVDVPEKQLKIIGKKPLVVKQGKW